MVKRTKPEKVLDSVAAEARVNAEREINTRRGAALDSMRNTNAVLEKRCRDLQAQLAEAEEVRKILESLESNPLERFEIKPREKTSNKNEATAVVILSDLHFEETVTLEETNALNEFSLEIATYRMDKLAIGLVWLLDMARAKGKSTGYLIRDLFLPCLGDVITNFLRNENMQSNFLTPFQAIIFAEDLIVRFVRTVLARCPWIESVYMPMVPGNHDRLSFSKSTPFTQRTEMSFAPILAHGLDREFKDEPRIKVELCKAEHHYTEIYGHTIRGMHGDRFGYHGGTGGIFVPARRHIAGLNKAIHAHLTMFGHWHTSKEDDMWVSNGSLIGVNAYSLGKGLDPEPPSQAFLLLDRDRGKRLCTPIHVGKKEEW